MDLPVESRRWKKKVDYKIQHEGKALPTEIYRKRALKKEKISVLPETYSIDRIICKKTKAEVSFLM